MVHHIHLASIHPESIGSVSNALRQCLGTRVHVHRIDPRDVIDVNRITERPVAVFIDLDGLSQTEAESVLDACQTSDVIPALFASDIDTVPTELANNYKIWACIASRPEGRFRKSVQSMTMDIINFHMLNEVEMNLRKGYHRTTRNI